eukprot:COSAG06_NODE_238_length_19422_cov_16.417741_8_plen_65_part_00
MWSSGRRARSEPGGRHAQRGLTLGGMPLATAALCDITTITRQKQKQQQTTAGLSSTISTDTLTR